VNDRSVVKHMLEVTWGLHDKRSCMRPKIFMSM